MITLASLADTGEKIINQFGIDSNLLIAQCINFVIVALLLVFWHLKRILSTIKDREKQIADSLKNADKIKLELEQTQQKQQDTLNEASMEAKKTVSVAQEQAKSLLEAQKEEARQEAEAIIAKAKSAMELERQNVLNDARQEIASLVILATSKVLDRELTMMKGNALPSRLKIMSSNARVNKIADLLLSHSLEKTVGWRKTRYLRFWMICVKILLRNILRS